MSAPHEKYGHVHVAGSGCCSAEASAKGVEQQIKETAEKQKQRAIDQGYAKASEVQAHAQKSSEKVEVEKQKLHEQVERGAQQQQDLVAKGLSGIQGKRIREGEMKAQQIEKNKQEAVRAVEAQAQASAERVAAAEEREREKLSAVAEGKLHGVAQKGPEEEKGFLEKVKEAIGISGEKEITKPGATETVTRSTLGGESTKPGVETVQTRTLIGEHQGSHRSM